MTVECSVTAAWLTVHVDKLLQIYGASPEILRAALFEVKIMSKLAHANLLPLLSSAVVPTPVENGVVQTCYMLLPLFPGNFSEWRI
jgi:hypothetical protein